MIKVILNSLKEDCVLHIDGSDQLWLRSFCNDYAIFVPDNVISLSETWKVMADGTFKSSTNYFQQHYLIVNIEERNDEERIYIAAEVSFLTAF